MLSLLSSFRVARLPTNLALLHNPTPLLSTSLYRKMSTNINTHHGINRQLVGTPVSNEPGKAKVELLVTKEMTADDLGLAHGGFIFGLADYAAMLAVNDPTVVLGSANVKFLKPTKLGDKVVAEAEVKTESGKKREVEVTATKDGVAVFSGTFTCFVLEKHILS
eukprot:comp18913_c1_seq1/m.21089 comp18913_c1_seq1/g.21089  ORF comp18913_c1_seq1/g.21089 comp18913_c1_seq1/m.21089 type:complete len:164 (-) comp18913_c1_seq1:44-535(-)